MTSRIDQAADGLAEASSALLTAATVLHKTSVFLKEVLEDLRSR